ncbi:MAG: type III pantothenate kinase [Flavobacteriales bacterium]|nr:type III pantothenate kinase [Flavobacteriales bacterium]
MNTVVDVGNTDVKIARFDRRDLISLERFSKESLPEHLAHFIKGNCLYSGSGMDQPELIEAVERKKGIILSSKTPLPIRLNYETIETLGLDRIANMCGARCIYTQGPVLAIDMGTCITYDILDSYDTYQGGAIAPGWQMRLKSMHLQTARLPLAPANTHPQPVGKSTMECLQSGAYWGMRSEISGMIALYSKWYSGLNVIITGGDHVHFENADKSPIFATPNLTVIGLNEILLHNIH